MKTYFALTIGPIYDTISSARTTREMWASSYLFSYIIKQFVEKFEANKMDILLPTTDLLKHKNFLGAGIYPDRIIAQADCKYEEIQNTINETIKDLAINIQNHLNKRSDIVNHSFNACSKKQTDLQDDIYLYLQKYLRIYYFKKEINDESQNIVNTIYPLLDSMELQPRILPIENFPAITYKRIVKEAPSKSHLKTSPLRLFTDLINGSFLIDDGFGTASERSQNNLLAKKYFNTLNEICTTELKQINNIYYKEFEHKVQKETNEVWQIELERDRKLERKGFTETESMSYLKKMFKSDFKTYHNYLAIIHADGDNVGKIIKNMKGNVYDSKGILLSQDIALKAFSKVLTKFSIDAAKIIADYGASSVYIGGDDLFFFAPVASRNKISNKWQCIFDLIKDIDNQFNTAVRDQKDYNFNQSKEEQLSLSYGLSITYRKFPLYEARNISYELMKIKAKKEMKGNSIATNIIKSSGHEIPFCISKKNPEIFQCFLDMIHTRIFSNENFINSITYKLESLREVLVPISNNPSRVKNFFENNFNENYKSNKDFYETLEQFIILLSSQNQSDKILSVDDYKLLYGTLRFIHFLRSKERE